MQYERNSPSHLRFGAKRSIQSRLVGKVAIASVFTFKRVQENVKIRLQTSLLSSFFFFILELLLNWVFFLLSKSAAGRGEKAHGPGRGGVRHEGAAAQMRVQDGGRQRRVHPEDGPPQTTRAAQLAIEDWLCPGAGRDWKTVVGGASALARARSAGTPL